jgi:hypothetical protein
MAAGLGALVFVIGTPKAQPQAPKDEYGEEIPKYDLSKATYYGAGSCAAGGCHTRPGEKDSTDFVQRTEYTVWYEKDKHSQAYLVLGGERATRMGKILGYDARKADACLNCHAMNFPEERRGDQFALENGVSCDGCHGPARYWYGDHIQQSWRLKSGRVKEAYGMIDVRDPVKRARMCNSCHVGSVPEGKVVTHEMYAAGHPPLPGFELATYSESLPRHWRLTRDVPFVRDPNLKKPLKDLKDPKALRARVHRLYHFDSAAYEETKLVMIGGTVAFREALLLLAGHAAGDKGPQGLTYHWPELAQFDCYACHHDLKSNSWRQRRGYSGAPGRPLMRPWPTALVTLALRHKAGDDDKRFDQMLEEFKKQLGELEQAFNAQPFGAPDKVGRRARNLAEWAGNLLKDVEKKAIDQDAAARILRELCAAEPRKLADYDSARQLAWAFEVIQAEVSPRISKDEGVRKSLDLLRTDLQLKLPYGKVAIESHLSGALKRINDFNPEVTRDRFRLLCERVDVLVSKQDGKR